LGHMADVITHVKF